MQQHPTNKRNGKEGTDQTQTQETANFAWQTNEIRQSQQQSPSFQSSFQNIGSQEDPSVKNESTENHKEAITSEQESDNNAQKDGSSNQNKQNMISMQTLNNSIDKLVGCYTNEDGYDMSEYIIFRDFQSDSKANSKKGSKRESKHETPKYTPRFNLNTKDMISQHQEAQFFEKSKKNMSNYQSQESFCYKEDRNMNFQFPNSSANLLNYGGANNAYHNFYSNNDQGQRVVMNNKMGQEDEDDSGYNPYAIYQKNGNKLVEKQQQLNSYHLPQQKKKKIILSNNAGASGGTNYANGNMNQMKNNTNYHHVHINGSDLPVNQKQMSMMIMMSQVQTHQKQYRLSKQQATAVQINDKQQQNRQNTNGRVCQTEPGYDELGEESAEYISRYKDALDRSEIGNSNYVWSDFEEQMLLTGNQRKQQLITKDNQPYGSNYYISDSKNISQQKQHQDMYNNNSKQVANGGDQDESDSQYNEEESYDVDQLRQNLMNEPLKSGQSNGGGQLASNTKHNNFINQKLYQNQIGKIRQQVMLQQQNNGKQSQKFNAIDSLQFDHSNRIIKRINTNPNGIGTVQQTPIRIGSSDSKKINNQSLLQNKSGGINGKNSFHYNENSSNFTHQQRKFRQMSAHAGSSSSTNNPSQQYDKNNHLIDEDYNNESFIHLNNIPQDANNIQAIQGDQSNLNKIQSYQNNFIKQQNNGKLDPYLNHPMQQTSSGMKKQLNYKGQYEDSNSSMSQQQSIKRKLQDFEKKKSINLNNTQQYPHQQPSSSSQSSGNNSKIQQPNQPSSVLSNQPPSLSPAANGISSAAQQIKKSTSLSRKKRSKTKSPSQKGLDSILEASQRLELSQSLLQDPQLKNRQSNNSDSKKQSLQQMNQQNSVSANKSNLNMQDSRNEDYSSGKAICKTEGNDSSSSLKANLDYNDSSRNVKTEQDYQLSTSASSTNKFQGTIQNQETAINQNKNVKLQKGTKRVQSANYNQMNVNPNHNLLHPQIALALNNNHSPLIINNASGPSPQQMMQGQANLTRGRFNSYQNSNNTQNQAQLSIQQLAKKLNIQSQSTTNNNNPLLNTQQNSNVNTLLKNQLKKRSFTPLSAANNMNSNPQNSSFKDTFFLNPSDQSLNRNNIKKISRNPKNYSEKDQLNLTASGAFAQQFSPISYQQLQINTQQQQTQQQQQSQQQVFPNLQKQLAKRNEIALLNNQSQSSQQQQQQQLQYQQQQQQQLNIQQRPSSRQVIVQNQQVNLNSGAKSKQQQQQPNALLNQTLSSKLTKI